MPLYDYACDGCGPFSTSRPMAQSSEPAACPSCGASSRRVLTMPTLLARRARSTQDGEGAQAAQAAPGYGRLRHVAGCGCCA